MSIPMTECKSSTVQSYGYDPETQTLAIKFASGGEYHYQNVPPDVAAGLEKAESVGKYIAATLRGKFGFTRP